jgi:DNA-directed RNA polymerase specialized sigma24 family protein
MQVQHHTPRVAPSLGGESVGVLLGRWGQRELRRASRFRECAGLTREDLEDLYQDSCLVLLEREFESEAHLRWALHEALKHRALNAHRNRTRRASIAEYAHSGDQALERAAEAEQASDRPMLAQQDEFLVREFLAELTEQERHVFRLLAEGHGWRGAADALGAPRNEIRTAARSCERKRERFALLYTTGRLCGYRAHTIQALTAGETESAVLARRAHAHLQACASCRIEHGTNGERFRRLFDRDALALLPLPVLVQRLPLCSRAGARANRIAQHLLNLLTGGGASTKLAVGAASIAVAAGGTIGATQALSHHTTPVSHGAKATRVSSAARAGGTSAQRPRVPAKAPAVTTRNPQESTTRTATRSPTPTTVSVPSPATAPSALVPLAPAATPRTTQSAARGFAYLGVPRSTAPSVPAVRRTSTQTVHGGLFTP